MLKQNEWGFPMIKKSLKLRNKPRMSTLLFVVSFFLFSYALLFVRENSGGVVFLLYPIAITSLIIMHRYVKKKNPSHQTKTFLYFISLSILFILIIPISTAFILVIAMFF
jgi:hypothetical protein